MQRQVGTGEADRFAGCVCCGKWKGRNTPGVGWPGTIRSKKTTMGKQETIELQLGQSVFKVPKFGLGWFANAQRPVISGLRRTTRRVAGSGGALAQLSLSNQFSELQRQFRSGADEAARESPPSTPNPRKSWKLHAFLDLISASREKNRTNAALGECR